MISELFFARKYNELLGEQFERFNKLEKVILLWCAVEREPVDEEYLTSRFTLLEHGRRSIKRAFTNVHNHCFVERDTEERKTVYYLQPVIQEFLSERLVDIFLNELVSSSPDYFKVVPLVDTDSKEYIHSHIVFNSTALDYTRKFRNFWRSSFAIRKISDMLCLENGLSVIAGPKPSRGNYGTWLGEDKPPSVRGQLEGLIDTVLGHGCKDFDSFLTTMKAAGVEVKRGKHLAFKIPNGKRFIRCDSLGEDYSEAAIMERISGKRIVTPKAKAAAPAKPNMLIDIQAKMQQANSPGFERWAKIFNLKEMAKTVMYLQENGLTDFGELEKACDVTVQKFNDLSDRTKATSARMKAISELQKQIGTYSKTRDIYVQYRKLTGKKQATPARHMWIG